MSTDTMVGDLRETSFSSSSEITETNTSSSSCPSPGVLTSTEVTSNAYDSELPVSYLTSATPCVTADDIVIGSHKFTFSHYSQRESLGVGKILVSDTFTVGGYDWAITRYPNGRKDKYKGYISIYIRLESEDTVHNERSTTTTPEGTNHSLTEYAMKYVASISQYKELLTDIIVSSPAKSLGNQADERFLKALHASPLTLHVIWIMISLKINLKKKSRFYKGSLLRYVFIINNVKYIIRTVEGSPELLEMIGRDYVSMLSKDVAQTEEDYFSSIEDRLLYCLRDNGLNYRLPFFKWISKTSLKKRFKTFNTTFEEVCQTHSFVVDMQLGGQFDGLMLVKLLPAYRSFLEKYGGQLQRERYEGEFIKYLSEELEGKIKKIVYGTQTIHNVVSDLQHEY